jgi:hypothetical protein
MDSYDPLTYEHLYLLFYIEILIEANLKLMEKVKKPSL